MSGPFLRLVMVMAATTEQHWSTTMVYLSYLMAEKKLYWSTWLRQFFLVIYVLQAQILYLKQEGIY